ncbi:MAG: 4-hydroxy-tetrahydrodipicolinate reductase [Oligoflexia bacterium]|nr:4-hydroxy-tetrahydrodipicolinate reductase [Oligoflexia bacterium]
MPAKLVLVGAHGKMGREVLSSLQEFPDIQLVAAIDNDDGELPESLREVVVSKDLAAHIKSCDGVIEFSSPAGSVQVAQLCAQYSKVAVLAATGHTPEQLAAIRKAATQTSILCSANFSLGILLLRRLLRSIPTDTLREFDIEIVETHHRNKKDAPSGTALELLSCLGDPQNIIIDRSARHAGRNKTEIGVASLRGGDMVGEHTVFLCANGERLELTHRAWSRRIFARGALTAFLKLLNRPAGLYSLDQLFESPLTA